MKQQPADQAYHDLRQRLNRTGIGFAGLDGVWWRPACEPFPLSKRIAQQLEEIGPALLTFIDAVVELYRNRSCQPLNRLLEYKVPDHIPRLVADGRVDSLRPDFQLCPIPGDDSSYQLKVTELEICPSAHGFAHAMQSAYGLATDLVEGFARYLDGRPLLFAGTQAWSEFLFEQLAFCRALQEVGGTGRVLYDLPLATLAEEVRRGERWQPPLFGIPYRPSGWDDDVTGRLKNHDLEQFVWPGDDVWPQDIGDAFAFRFGYFDCFSNDRLRYFSQWQGNGARLLNPTTFFLENKAMMAAIDLPDVRQQLDETTLDVLDRCLPQTIPLTEDNLNQVLDEKDDWVVKYAAYDGGEQAWGGRSLEIGHQHTGDSWRQALEGYLALPWPAVAQRAIPTARVNLHYLDAGDNVRLLTGGYTRLRVFFLRDKGPSNYPTCRTSACGSHITVSEGKAGVAEGLLAVQAPTIFV